MKNRSHFVCCFLTVFCLLMFADRAARAEIFLMDFNTTDTGSYPGGSSAWNIYAAPSNINGGLIKDTSGFTAAGVTLSVTGTITDSGNGNTAVFNNATGGPAWVTTDGSLANTGAAGDYFYTSTAAGSHSFTMTLANLTRGNTISLDLWTSRVNSTGIGLFDYSVDGGATWNGFTVLAKDGSLATDGGWDTHDTTTQSFHLVNDGNNSARYMTTGDIVLPGTTLSFRTSNAGAWTAIGAARLIVPEPSATIMLLALACVAILRRQGITQR